MEGAPSASGVPSIERLTTSDLSTPVRWSDVIARLDPLLPPAALPLDPEALRALVEALAGSPDLWTPRVQGVGTIPAVSIHASSPPLVRMGVYGVASDGTLRREAVGAAHELRAEGFPA